jgi:hypothetical protein
MVYSLQRFEFMWLRPTNLTNKSDDQCADETRPDTHFMGATIRRWLHSERSSGFATICSSFDAPAYIFMQNGGRTRNL